ncbi:MAG TPA: tRNA pseudouridine(38-40) synthase TruA [Longimicrobiales bacterium]|nr:tRNA pseudouridine(38-40) synthase TruA [Longimicrobiales bacterium]
MIARTGPDEHRLRLTLQYDGSSFAGWQVQPAKRTVQGELEAALARITTRPVRVTAAGRTDAGVHATGQVVSLTVSRQWTPERLQRALNAVLPRDVWVASAAAANPEFHARYDARARGYVYRVGTSPLARSPFLWRRCWPLCEALDRDALDAAAARLQGEHSFRAFARSGQPHRGDRCVVHLAEWREWQPAGLRFRVVANRFLHHMVRYLVGTMVDVARGRRGTDEVAGLLEGVAGLGTSPPAPPGGLYLTDVYYEGDSWTGEDVINEVLS